MIRCHRSPLARVQLMTDPYLWEALALSCQSADCYLVSLSHFAKSVRQVGPGTVGETDKI